jgi:hypothetical protein
MIYVVCSGMKYKNKLIRTLLSVLFYCQILLCRRLLYTTIPYRNECWERIERRGKFIWQEFWTEPGTSVVRSHHISTQTMTCPTLTVIFDIRDDSDSELIFLRLVFCYPCSEGLQRGRIKLWITFTEKVQPYIIPLVTRNAEHIDRVNEGDFGCKWDACALMLCLRRLCPLDGVGSFARVDAHKMTLRYSDSLVESWITTALCFSIWGTNFH